MIKLSLAITIKVTKYEVILNTEVVLLVLRFICSITYVYYMCIYVYVIYWPFVIDWLLLMCSIFIFYCQN